MQSDIVAAVAVVVVSVFCKRYLLRKKRAMFLFAIDIYDHDVEIDAQEAAQMSNISRRRRRQFHAAIRARLSAINAKRHIMAWRGRERLWPCRVDAACLRFALDTFCDPRSVRPKAERH